jgi:hypothetical protein
MWLLFLPRRALAVQASPILCKKFRPANRPIPRHKSGSVVQQHFRHVNLDINSAYATES